MNITIRPATVSDAPQLQAIYAYYVQNTAVTFEYDPPTVEEFAARIRNTLEKYPYLVICEDGRIAGFAFARAFRARPAYDYSAETTIYLHHDRRSRGLGRAVYTALEEELRRMGVRNLYACVGYNEDEDAFLTHTSPLFHEHMGYRTVGLFRNCGYKFGRWYGMIWMEKIIGDYPDRPEPLKKAADRE